MQDSVIQIKSLIPQKILKTKAEKFCFLKEELQDILRLPIIWDSYSAEQIQTVGCS